MDPVQVTMVAVYAHGVTRLVDALAERIARRARSRRRHNAVTVCRDALFLDQDRDSAAARPVRARPHRGQDA
ncbi:hypothetical protein ACRYCC_15320 [Actinomadura scrupuli]|uniref:hypothetical protein n=1 Tax=Actinomadura scrupuli TaxID=559629 RepID=UPI003D95A235